MSDLLPFRSQPASVGHHVDIRDLVLDICATLAETMTGQGIVTEVDIPHGETVPGDRQQLRQAVLQVVQQALRSMPTGGELTFSSFRTAHFLELEIADSGPGFPVDTHRHADVPPGRARGRQTVAPLVSVARILALSGGSMRMENCPQGGGAVTLHLPCRSARAAA